MMDLWSLLAYQLISLIAGAVTGAVALILGGAGSMRVLAKRLALLEERQDHTDDRLTSEVKRRAAAVAVEKRSTAASLAAEADAVLVAAGKGLKPVSGQHSAGNRPSVVR